jgi:hypothetical protein
MTSNSSPAEPSLALGDMRGQRYPNQFFDLAQQYMPPTIKELFRWCTYYYYNSPLIGSAMKKISRYPITDLILEDDLESNRNVWDKILNKELSIKDKLMEINLDYHTYGNAFVSVHFPFTRFLICKGCRHSAPIRQWKWDFRGSDFQFSGVCTSCNASGRVDVKDVPYRSRKGIRLIRWNPENIHIKFNEYTGRYIYMYSVPGKLRNAILRGDRDIVEDIPVIVLEALKNRRMIRFNSDNIRHLKAPTLAEQDQGWGKPAIIHVLKDMYYLYTLRRAQEAIAMEHIVPFDMIYPLPNAQQDPYIHTDLASWRQQVENVIIKHRRDPNFKGVIPIPIGFGRLGGDGKALLLAPEITYLTQTIVGGLGLPQEFLFGGLNWSGSSVSLRTLENDFIQNRSQLLSFTHWLKDKLRTWLNVSDLKDIRFADFRMADDIQRNQQLIGLNAQRKVSDQTLLTELGYNYDAELKKLIEEQYAQNYLMDLQAKAGARTQGEASIIQFNYQQTLSELGEKAQLAAQERAQKLGIPGPMDQPMDPNAAGGPGGDAAGAMGVGGVPPGSAGGQPTPGMPMASAGGSSGGKGQEALDQQIDSKVESWSRQLLGMTPGEAALTLSEVKQKMPEVGARIETRLNQLRAEGGGGDPSAAPAAPMPGAAPGADASAVNMNQLPEQKTPRRQGAV